MDAGGRCKICGYNKCFAALQFHHRDPTEKEILLNSGKMALSNMAGVLKEIEKCDLLCANCHAELHFNMEQK
jgi:hypothetical protein